MGTYLKVDDNGGSREKLTSFHFPLDEDLPQKWVKLVDRRDREPTSTLIFCKMHFDENLITQEELCFYSLKRDLHPVPTRQNPLARKNQIKTK